MKTYVIELPNGKIFRVDMTLKSEPALKYILTEQVIFDQNGNTIELNSLDDNESFILETEIKNKLNEDLGIKY